jgi:hypothetical protein
MDAICRVENMENAVSHVKENKKHHAIRVQYQWNHSCKSGSMVSILRLHENRVEGCTTGAMNGAAEHGHLEVIKWLHINRQEGCTTNAMNCATRNGHLDIIKWLHENRTEGCTTIVMNKAAIQDHLEVVKWLHVNRQEGCTQNAMDFAAFNDHIDVIKWLHENRTNQVNSCHSGDNQLHHVTDSLIEFEEFARPYLKNLREILQHRCDKGYRNMRFLRYKKKRVAIRDICEMIAPRGEPSVVGFVVFGQNERCRIDVHRRVQYL